jgi:hypothetical protein
LLCVTLVQDLTTETHHADVKPVAGLNVDND